MDTIRAFIERGKRIYFVLVGALMLESGNSQITYFKYLDYTVQYRTEYSGWNGIASFFINTNFYIVGDTLINGNWYYKQNVNNVCQNASPQFTGPFYIREDSNNRVYYYNTTTNTDILSTDWNQYLSLTVGSPWPIAAWNCSVTTIDSVQVGTQYLKRWHGPLSNTSTSPYCVVEGIGAIGPICGFGIEGDKFLTCYKKQNNQLTFVPSTTNCAFVNSNPITTNLKSNSPDSDSFSIYPNPADDHVFISLEDKPYQLRIFNLLGQLVTKIKITGNNRLDVTMLYPGMYIFQIGDESSFIKTERVIIN